MNDTLKQLSRIIDLRDNGTITELEQLLQIHDLWRNLQNTPQSARDMCPDFNDVYYIVDFAYIHFKQCCETELEKAVQ